VKRTSLQTLRAVAVVSSYAPRRCGIATFARDLTEAVATAAPQMNTLTVAVNDRPEGYRYPPRVAFEINQNRLPEYRLAADFLNMSNVDVCCVQHEFGLFGGPEGSHLIEMLRRLRMPVVTTLHTVLQEPNDAQRQVMSQLGEICDRFVIMAERAREFLCDIYGISDQKLALIPHGIPDVPFFDPNYYKDQFGVEGKKVILTFGLLGPSKGIENMVEALPRIIKKHPDVIYIVLGATHPGVVAYHGEDYRLSLQRRAKELGIEQYILWVNKFVEVQELIEFLGAADVYVTPYLNEAQITSGTLAYAVGAGKATVSTPYWHAQELLAHGRGRIVPFGDPNALGQTIIDLFDNETQRHAMRKRGYQYMRASSWKNVSQMYLDLFQEVRKLSNRNPKPRLRKRHLQSIRPDLEEIKLDHLQKLTDDTGVFQRTKLTVPDRSGGYTTDDNARALVAVLLAREHVPFNNDPSIDALICRYLSFLEYAFNDQAERFRHHLGYDRRWTEQTGSEESHGRAIWALGETVARCPQRGYMTLAATLFQRALPGCETLNHPHGWAYSLIGIHAYLRRFSGDTNARRIRESLAHSLNDCFVQNISDEWMWHTDTLTYSNSRLPHALLLSGRWMFNNEIIQLALRILDWLWEQQSAHSGHFAPVGNDGWFVRGGEKARFDQQPLEASAMIDASLEAYRVTADRKWLDRSHQCLDWFLGENDLYQPLYDSTTGGCAEALGAYSVSENQNAESTLAWLLALTALYNQRLDEDEHPTQLVSENRKENAVTNKTRPTVRRRRKPTAVPST